MAKRVSHSKKEASGLDGRIDPVTDLDAHDVDGAEVDAPSTLIPISFTEKQRLLESYRLTKLIAGRGVFWNRDQ